MSTETYELPVPAAGLPNVRVAIIGAGKMGGILLQAFPKNNLLHTDQLLAPVQQRDRARGFAAGGGGEGGTGERAAAREGGGGGLGVKPWQVPGVGNEIAP